MKSNDPKLHKSQAFVVERVKRSDLKGAKYNPRSITEAARRKLKKGLEKLGLLQPVAWNRKSGNVVGGHQRLKILDALAGGEVDYLLDVAVVELDEKQEKEANLLLNTDTVTGDFDLELLAPLLNDASIDIEATGFDAGDVYRLLGEGMTKETELDAIAEKVKAARERYRDIAAKMSAKNQDRDEFYMVVVFRNGKERSEFLAAAGLDENRYQSGAVLAELFRARARAAPEPQHPPASSTD